MHKESALINKLNKQTTVQFNNYTRLLGQTYARATETYSGGASPEVTRLFYLWVLTVSTVSSITAAYAYFFMDAAPFQCYF